MKSEKTSLSDIFSWVVSGAENFKFGVKKNLEAPIWSPSRSRWMVVKRILYILGIVLLVAIFAFVLTVAASVYLNQKPTC
jgi:hypothetical protein